MKLNFDNRSLEISSRKVITGVISIVVGNDRFFPEQYWNDIVITILNSWIQNVIHILKDGQKEAEFVFFDGPFSFLVKKKEGMYMVELLQNSKSIGNYSIDFNEFGYHLVKSSREILEEINKRQWESDDVKQFSLSVRSALPYFNL